MSRIYYSRISSDRKPHPDEIVEALLEAAWADGEPMNAYDDAEEIVGIVRRAIEAKSNPLNTIPRARYSVTWGDAVIKGFKS